MTQAQETAALAGGAGTTAPAEGQANAGGQGAAGEDPQFVTKADFEKLAAQVNSLPGMFHRKLSELKDASALTTEPTKKAGTTEDEVAKLRKEIEDGRAKNAAKERSIALREVVAQFGLDEQRGKLLRTYLEKEHGDKIKNGDDGSIFVEGELGAKKPLGEFVSEVLKNEGLVEFFKPPSKVPAVSSAWHGTGKPQGQITATMADLQAGRVDPKDFRSGKVVLVEG